MDMIVQKDMPYGSGSAHRLDLYTPHQPSGNLLLYFHGGGLEGGDKSDLILMPEMLTDQGITLVSANYRMYPEARFPDYVDDCARAAAWAWQYAQSQASPLGLDPRLVRLDEAAPIFHITQDFPAGRPLPRLLILLADHDMPNRLEQNRLLMGTLLHFGYPQDHIGFRVMQNAAHCQYTGGADFCRQVVDFVG